MLRVCNRLALAKAGFAEAPVIGVRLGEPGDAGELVAIWLRSVLSVRALMGRRAGPQAHYHALMGRRAGPQAHYAPGGAG